MIRKLAKEAKTNISILQDLQGPKFDARNLRKVVLQSKNKNYFLTNKKELENSEENPNFIFVNFDNLLKDIKIGERVLMDDGLLILP